MNTEKIPTSGDSQLRILIIDDEDMMLDFIGKALTKLGHQPVAHRNGNDALKTVYAEKKESRKFDVFMIDFNLGDGENGYEVATRILAEDPEAKIICLSGDAYDPAIVNFDSYGFKASITKPFTLDTLQETIQLAYRS